MTTQPDEDVAVPLAPNPVLVGGTIHIGSSVDSQAQAADFGTYLTYVTAVPDVARPILPYDSNRHRAVLTVSTNPTASKLNSTMVYGSATSPGVNGTIADLSASNLSPGLWQFQVITTEGGTLAAALDTNNMQLVFGTGANLQVVTLAASTSGAAASSGPFTFYFPPGASILDAQVQSIVAATAGAIYHAEIIATPLSTGPGAGVWIGTQAQCQASPPVGGFIPSGGGNYAMEHNAAMWMIGDGVTSQRVTVAMERWA